MISFNDNVSTPSPSTSLLTTSQACKRFNVCPNSLRSWANEGKIRAYRIPNGWRRYDAQSVADFLGIEEDISKNESCVNVAYLRVSSQGQESKGSRERQKEMVLEAIKEGGGNVEEVLIFEETASAFGNRPQLNKGSSG